MNLDSLSFALSQISYSVANLTKKNYKNTVNEISHLVSQHGAAADRHLFRCLFSHIDFSGDGRGGGKDFHQIQYLTQECASLLTKTNFVSTLCYAVDSPLHHQKTLKPYPYLFSQLSKILKLTRIQEVSFGLALLHSANSDTRNFAAQFVRQKLPHLLNTYIDIETSGEGGIQDIAIEVLHLLLSNLEQDKDHFGINTEQKEAFLNALRKDFPKERVPVVLAPLLYTEGEDQPASKLLADSIILPKSMMDGSLAEMIKEIGYPCTASLDECRNTLVQFGVRELTAAAIARTLGMMADTAVGLTTADQIPVQSLNAPGNWNDARGDNASLQHWNIDNFVSVVQQLAPHITWRDVVNELDYPEFTVKSRQGLHLIVQSVNRSLQEVFPIEFIYRPWKNTEGQLSWITHSLKNQDVFCFADYPFHPVVIDVLKSPPDEESRDITTWKSLDLVDVLLWLSESHFQPVSELFKFPMQHCPDMLVLALLQSTQNLNTLKHELLSRLIPIFLGNHPNSAIILHYAWHCQGQSSTVRTLLMHSMAEWYMHGDPHDQLRLSRILDVAQDLKALSMLLNATPFAFVIDLACLASRREYLKLDKWLSDKIREHQEPFVQACVGFLKRRCPHLLTGAFKDENAPQVKSQQLPTETITTTLACLQACAGNVTQELSEMIMTMVGSAQQMLAKQRQAPPGVIGAKGPSITPGMPSLPPAVSNPMEGLGGGHLGLGSVGTSAVGSFPSSLSSMTSTPGSPAKVFPNITVSQPSGQPYNPMSMQNLTSQLQGLTMPSSLGGSNPIGASIGAGTLGGSNIGAGTIGGSLGVGNLGATGLGAASIGAGNPSGGNALGALGGGNPSLGAGSLGGSNLGGGSLSTSAAGRTPTLGALSAQAIRQQQQSQADRMRQAQSGEFSSSFFPNSQQFSKEIEDEANTYFQRIYNHSPHPSVTIDEVLEMLKRFKDSPSKKEKDVFACMQRNLFEEYRFFPQYPDKELHTTAVLFGGIIEQGLVTYMELGLALRYVLEALKKPHGTKMYYFGIAALDRFKTRLKDYPQYCQYLGSIPHFSQFPPHLIEYVEYGARSQEPPTRPKGSVTSVTGTTSTTVTTMATTTITAPSSATAGSTSSQATTTSSSTPSTSATPLHTKPSIANATNIDTLLAGTESSKEEIAVPPENVQDKVFFIFNNLSLSNINQKSEELKEHVGEEYIIWVSQYLVMKRASIEPNFHTLYANFIDTLKFKDFTHLVIRETYRNIKVLLRSDKGVANFSDRSLLKNLGHWLGLLTLAKNKPILHVDIDLKTLIYEAYHKGAQELLYVVPFVAKVIESCWKSKVFKPPNPWTIGIMNVLAELHQEPDLKLNLKFEIEVLCKTLTLDINDLNPGNYLKDTMRLNTLETQLSGKKPRKEEEIRPTQSDLPIPAPPVAATATVTTTTAAAGTTATSTVQSPPMPKYNYNDLNVMSMAGLASHIEINEELALFTENPQLKQAVRPAIERSVQELLPPVVERSVKIALTACEQIVKKDCALDPEEARMRGAAHHMVRNMTAGMALITCREPLVISINNNLKKAFLGALMGASQAQKDQIEQAAQVLAQDNTELACVFIQKTAVEKAIPEMDKRLATEFEMRKHARNDNRRYCDPVVLTYQAERMPEQIRLKVGGVTPQQMAVYEEFARNIPGFAPTQPDSSAASAIKNAPIFGTDEISAIFDKVARDMEAQMRPVMNNPSSPLVAALPSLLEAVYLARQSREVVTALALLQKAVEGLLEGLTLQADSELLVRYRDCHLLVLKGLQDQRAYGPQWTNRQITRCLIECRQEYRYNIEAVDVLIRSHLVQMQQYDHHLAQSMENGVNFMAVTFAMQLIQRFCVDEKPGTPLNPTDLHHTIETLTRIATHSRQLPEGLANLLETLRQRGDEGLLDKAPGGAVSMIHSGMSDAGQYDDPPGLHEKTEYLLREWVNMFHSPAAGRDSAKAFAAFVGQMHQQGILKTDDLITRFFRLCTEMCVDLCYRALAEQSHSPTLVRAKCFHTLDAFVRLIALLVKHSGDATNSVTKINLLNKVLGIVAGVLLQDHEVRGTEFQQLPYHRIFIMLFIELNGPEHVLEGINFQVLTAFCNTFHLLRPAKAPGFAFAWLELISHRVFIGRMLALTPQQRGWSMYAQLLIDLFKFLTPFLRNAELQKPTQLLYKGTMRVLLVLLHDFPEFLCDYHYAFCDVIPPNCIQMRNLILSAFPHNMRLPDPFTPNLKVDRLSEIAQAPRVMTNFVNMIQPATFKKDLESYLKTRAPVTFLSDLRSSLQMTAEPGMRYNIQLINALVLYVGTQAISYIHSKGLTPSMSTIAHSSHMDIFQNLAVDLDTEGRYLFLNAIANQLRYPNSHTHYFSCTLLYLFAESNSEAIQEQITRVLLERLIVNRPHPWGLLVTFIELIKNPQFKFWSHEFVHCAPEIEKLFDSVARSCVQHQQAQARREGESQEMAR